MKGKPILLDVYGDLLRDINGQIILSNDRVKPVGNCLKTNEKYSMTEEMWDMINKNKYYKIEDPDRSRKNLIMFEDFNWHPLDVEVKRNLIKSEPIKSEKFDINNLEL